MSAAEQQFENRIATLKARLVEQGDLVRRVIEAAVEAVFDRDAGKARRVIEHDETIDRVDVEIERDAVAVLSDALEAGVRLSPRQVRVILTIVKVNNEFERIADLSVDIATRIDSLIRFPEPPPPKVRVIANSVIGIMQTTNTAFAHSDVDAARLVLASDDATEAFKEAILKDVAEQLARGELTVDFALALRIVAFSLGRMADHCTNVAEQVIYSETGKIVRHTDHWTEPEDPPELRTGGGAA